MVRRQATISLLAVAVTVIATLSVTSQTRALMITGVNVVDVMAGRIVPNRTVSISGDTITSVIQGGGAAPADAQVVDGRGTFLIPGLWDMHAHVTEMWLPLYVANGVTAIRDMGNDLDEILRLRAATSSGRIVGPRILAAGPILDDAPGDWPLRMRVKNAEEGRAAVQLLRSRGVDLIKVHNFTPRDVFFAIAEGARRHDLPLAGHVPLKVTVEEAIEAGLTSIEHFSEDGRVWKACSGGAQYNAEACGPFFEMLARRRIWQTPTLLAMSEVATIGTSTSKVSADQLAYASKAHREGWAFNQSLFATPDAIRALRAGAEVNATVTRDMARAGIGILAGCDMMIAGFCLHDELAAMVRGGMTPLEALQTATLNPARYFHLEQTVGRVAPGHRADLVLLNANPLADITNVRRIHAVVVGGRLLDRNELNKLLAQVKGAAEQQ